MQLNWIQKGFIAAGLANILGVLINSKFFSNELLNQQDPVVMSNFGLLMIIVWGLAYIATANIWQSAKWLVGVFCIEKIIYSAVWVCWMSANYAGMGDLYNQDFTTGLFYSIYGINDIIFAVFFAVAFVKAGK